MLSLVHTNSFILDERIYPIKIVRTEVGKAWFKADDVCKALGYKVTKDALRRHVKDSKDKQSLNALLVGVEVATLPTFRRNYEGQQPYVSEPGVYALIFGSKLPSANKFRTWVFDEVLPSINKTGQFQTQALQDALLQIEESKKEIEQERKDKEAAQSLAEQHQKDKETAQVLAEQHQKDKEAAQSLAEQHQKDKEAAQVLAEQHQKDKEAAQVLAEQAQKDKEAAQSLADQHQKDKEAAQAYSTILKDMLIKDEPVQKNQCVYISTSSSYAKQNRFKVGGVESSALLMKRLSTYNSNRTVGDEWYFSNIFQVVDYRNIEQRLKSLIGQFRDKASKEIYRMHYSSLLHIVSYLCDNYDEEVDYVNGNLSDYIAALDISRLTPFIPPPATVKLITTTDLPSGRQTTTIEQQLKSFLTTLPSEKKEISRKEVFDAINLRTGRTRAYAILEELISKFPELTLLKQRR